MSNSVQKKIINNLEKAKSEGQVRVEHIREIVKEAVGKTIAEVKQGGGEIGLIVKDAIATVIGNLEKTGTDTQAEITASIEGAVEGLRDYRQQTIAKQQSKLEKLQAEVNDQQQLLDQEIDGVLIDIKSIEQVNSESLNSAVDTVQAQKKSSLLQEQYLNLKRQLENLDEKLQERYGDRYGEVKQHLENAKIWYDTTKAESEASGISPIEQTQVQIENQLTEFASKVAQKEHDVKEHLHELWNKKKKEAKSKR